MAIVEVIQYNGNPDVFAWKYPNNELGTWTQLIVKAENINSSGRFMILQGNWAGTIYVDDFMPLED